MGHLSHSTTFATDDWRNASPVFHGATFRRNLETVAALEAFAQQEFATSVSRPAVAWALARPGIDVGTRSAAHVDDAVRAVDLELDADALARIDEITAGAVTVTGPSPEGV